MEIENELDVTLLTDNAEEIVTILDAARLIRNSASNEQ